MTASRTRVPRSAASKQSVSQYDQGGQIQKLRNRFQGRVRLRFEGSMQIKMRGIGLHGLR